MMVNVKKLSCIIIFGTLILMANFSHSGAPEGTWESIPYDIKREVVNGLMEQGLCDDCDRYLGGLTEREKLLAPKIIENAILTYLLDNRNLLTSSPIPKHRQIDVLLCLMMSKDRPDLGFRFSSNFCPFHIKSLAPK